MTSVGVMRGLVEFAAASAREIGPAGSVVPQKAVPEEAAVTTVKFEDLALAFEFVSSGAPDEHEAFVSLDTGAIHWNVDDEEMPDDLDSERYLAIPHKNDLDLGRELVLRFAEERMPQRYDRIDGIFRSRGAYGRFKDLLEAEGRLDEWYAYEAAATARALREWCQENGIHVIEA